MNTLTILEQIRLIRNRLAEMTPAEIRRGIENITPEQAAAWAELERWILDHKTPDQKLRPLPLPNQDELLKQLEPDD